MRILIYTDGEVIGDGVIRLPLIIALKKTVPNAQITWVTGSPTVYTSVLSEIARPLIHEFIHCPAEKLKWSDVFTPFNQLKGKHFDIIIDLQRVLKKSLRLKRTSHDLFVTSAAHYLISDRKPVEDTSSRKVSFFTQMKALISAAIGRDLDVERLSYPDTDHWDKMAAELLPSGKKYLGLIVGAGHPKKCWTLTSFIDLALKWQSRGLTPVFFLGPSEQAMKSEIQQGVPDAVFPEPADGKFSPYLTMAMAKRLTAAVANDSGGGHLLATANPPMVSLIRSSTVRTKFLPNVDKVIALAPEDFGGTLMGDIPVSAVDAALSKIINPESV